MDSQAPPAYQQQVGQQPTQYGTEQPKQPGYPPAPQGWSLIV